MTRDEWVRWLYAELCYKPPEQWPALLADAVDRIVAEEREACARLRDQEDKLRDQAANDSPIRARGKP